MKIEDYEQLVVDVLVFLSKENTKQEQLNAFIEMVIHLVESEDLVIDRDNERIYWTATGDTLGCLDD